MVTTVFKPRISSNIPVLSHCVKAVLAYLNDGLYPASNINTALRNWMKEKGLLDCSHATTTGTKVGIPVATVSRLPSFCFFTNYNGVGERDKEQGESASEMLYRRLTWGRARCYKAERWIRKCSTRGHVSEKHQHLKS